MMIDPFPLSFYFQDNEAIIRLATVADYSALFEMRCEKNNRG